MKPWPVAFHVVADNPTVGLWCDDCNLPSVIECPVVLISLDGVSQAGVWRGCLDCGDEGDVDDDLVCG